MYGHFVLPEHANFLLRTLNKSKTNSYSVYMVAFAASKYCIILLSYIDKDTPTFEPWSPPNSVIRG